MVGGILLSLVRIIKQGRVEESNMLTSTTVQGRCDGLMVSVLDSRFSCLRLELLSEHSQYCVLKGARSRYFR